MTAPPEPHHRLRIHLGGPWPFITVGTYTLAGRRFIWHSRQHRKGLDWRAWAAHAPAAFWQTRTYNWLVGASFALGALLFVAGSLLSLPPASHWPAGAAAANMVFFLGSVPFTFAAYLQLFQAANARPFSVDPDAAPRAPIRLIGWHVHNAGWLSSFSQFTGTLAFNMNTWDAMHTASAWLAQDQWVWAPDMIGSALFLISGYLAFLEISRGYWSWRPRDIAWQIVAINLIGCVAFMTAAVLSFTPRRPEAAWIIDLGNIHLLIGSACFFIGAVLTIREGTAAATG